MASITAQFILTFVTLENQHNNTQKSSLLPPTPNTTFKDSTAPSKERKCEKTESISISKQSHYFLLAFNLMLLNSGEPKKILQTKSWFKF
jgi:hypothetical protein